MRWLALLFILVSSALAWEGGANAPTTDAAATIGSLRTLGTGALQATAGNDSRLSDSRTPTVHAPAHHPGGSDPLDATYTVTTRSVTAGVYLTGGGNLSEDRTFALAIGSVSAAVTPTWANIQSIDAEIAALAGLTSAADSAPYFTGSGTAVLATLTAAGRTLIAGSTAAAQRYTLSLPDPLAIGGIVVDGGDRFYRIGGGTTGQVLIATTGGTPTWESSSTPGAHAPTHQPGGSDTLDATYTVTTRQILAGVGMTGGGNLSTDRTLNVDSAVITPTWANLQSIDAEIAALAGLTSAADSAPYFTGSGAAALTTLTAYGRTLVDDVDAATARTTLGLGTIAVQAANNVDVTGGNISGITDLAVADGGTGASTAADARTNLGLVIGTNVQAQDAELQAIAGLVSAADQLPYFTGSGTAALTALTATGRSILDDTSVSAVRGTLEFPAGLVTTGNPAQFLSAALLLATPGVTITGDVTGSGSTFAATIANDAVTYAKMQNVSASDLVWGRSTAGAGDVEEIACTAAGRTLIAGASAAAQATSLGLGTGDSPQFTAVNIGHATDTTLTRTGAGDVAVEGNVVYRAGGTDVPIADGGTGSSTMAGAQYNLGVGNPTAAGDLLAGMADGRWYRVANGTTNQLLHATTTGTATWSAVVEADQTLADNTTNDVSTAKHGYVPKLTAPGAGLLNAMGIGNGETTLTAKALFDTTNPANNGTAAPGTQLVAARRDHVHAADVAAASGIGGILYDGGSNPWSRLAAGTAGQSLVSQGAAAPVWARGVGALANKTINPNMEIDQRNAGAAVTINTNVWTYAVDRWAGYGQAADGVYTLQQLSATPPEGSTHYLRATVTTTDTSVGASQIYAITQKVEGVNCRDLSWGTSGAHTVTLGFYVRSSLTGDFSGSLSNSATNRSYPFTINIASANTWEYKTVTIAGDTAGTWLTTTGIGIHVFFDIGCGSSLRGTAATWTAAGYFGVTSAVSLIGTLSATFDLTQVTLVKATVDPRFVARSYTQEEQLCQRYYARLGFPSSSYSFYTAGYNVAGEQFGHGMPLPVAMRAIPTVTKMGTWYQLNCGQPEVYMFSTRDFYFYVWVTAATRTIFACDSPDDGFTFEAEL